MDIILQQYRNKDKREENSYVTNKTKKKKQVIP